MNEVKEHNTISQEGAGFALPLSMTSECALSCSSNKVCTEGVAHTLANTRSHFRDFNNARQKFAQCDLRMPFASKHSADQGLSSKIPASCVMVAEYFTTKEKANGQ